MLAWTCFQQMARATLGRSLAFLGAAALLLAAADAWAVVPIIGYYKLDTGSARNLVATGEEMMVRNAPFTNDGLYLNGIYISNPGGCLAKTDTLHQLDFGDFAAVVEFKTDRTGVAMPALVMGLGYRPLVLRIGANNQLSITLNNNTVSYPLPGTAIQPGTWYKAAVALDLANGTIRFSLNGGSPYTISLPPGFTLDILAADVSDANRIADANFLFTDYSNGSTFSGHIRTLIVYGNSVSGEELRQVTTTLPSVPGSNITIVNPGRKVLGSGSFDLSVTSTVNLPITVTSMTPSICTISGFTVTPVSEGVCTLVADQAGSAANATTSFNVSAVDYGSLTRINSGRGVYLVAPDFDLRASIGNGTTPGYDDITYIDRTEEIIHHVYAGYGNYFDGIFLVNNNPDSSVVQGVGYYGNNQGITSNETGLGGEPWSRSSELGALPRLRSFMHIPWRGGITGGPSLHEIMHNWGNKGFTPNPDDSIHWGYASTNGQLGGFDRSTLTQVGPNAWSARAVGRNGFGPMANWGNSVPYGNVELYLMGLIPPSALEPVMVAINPHPTDAYGSDTSYFTADGFTTFTAADLIASAGPRFPPADFSQKRFDILFILISNVTPTTAEIAEFDAQIEEFTRQGSDGRGTLYNFWEATGGRAIIVPVDIASVPSPTAEVSSNEVLIDWAEHVFPSLFPSPGRTRGQTEIYDYACYATGYCLGLDAERNVYYYDGHSILPVGRAADYSSYMRAAGF